MEEPEVSKYCTLYIVRHGQTEWNAKGLVQGHSDSPLTPDGQAQARLTAEILEDVAFDEIFSSDLLRARRTAEIIKLERDLAVKTTEKLREQHYGSFEGGPKKDLFTYFDKWKYLSSNEERFSQRFVPDMETVDEAEMRFITFIREVAIAYPSKTVLISTHGGIMHNFLVKMNYALYEELVKVENGAFIKLESDGVDFFISQTHGIRLRDDSFDEDEE